MISPSQSSLIAPAQKQIRPDRALPWLPFPDDLPATRQSYGRRRTSLKHVRQPQPAIKPALISTPVRACGVAFHWSIADYNLAVITYRGARPQVLREKKRSSARGGPFGAWGLLT